MGKSLVQTLQQGGHLAGAYTSLSAMISFCCPGQWASNEDEAITRGQDGAVAGGRGATTRLQGHAPCSRGLMPLTQKAATAACHGPRILKRPAKELSLNQRLCSSVAAVTNFVLLPFQCML